MIALATLTPRNGACCKLLTMHIRTPLLRWFAVLLLIYSQAALALAPCISNSATPASAFSDMPEDCLTQFEANLCLAHCQTADQSDLQPQIPALPMLDTVVLRLPYRMYVGAACGQWRVPDAHRSTGPPSLILLCSFNL